MESTLSVYPVKKTNPTHKFAELYEIHGMENITVSESEPSSSLYPFLTAVGLATLIAVINIISVGLPH